MAITCTIPDHIPGRATLQGIIAASPAPKRALAPAGLDEIVPGIASQNYAAGGASGIQLCDISVSLDRFSLQRVKPAQPVAPLDGC